MQTAAIYLPGFHDCPLNSAWWGEGATEWDSVRSARSLAVNHQQPRTPSWGYYDLSDPRVIAKQAALSKEFGIDGFCIYHYWSMGKRPLKKPVEVILSHAIERYKEAKEREKRQNSQTDAQLNRQLRMLKKEFRRLDDFVAFTGNKEFTSDNCNVSLRLYKDELMRQYDKPETAKRALAPCAAAFRMFADEVATNVAITKVTVKGQTAASKVRPVLDIETELPLVWAAAHDDSYDHFFRLAVFGIFSGSHASELVQTDVNKVNSKKGYYISGGTKTTARLRPVVIVNDTHRELLLKFAQGAPKEFTSVCGFRANQTESRHSKLLKEQLIKATGNPELTPYSLRHTGKHLGEIKGVSNLETFQRMLGWTSGSSKVKDDYGRAGVFSASMINSYREITQKLLEDLPDHERPTPVASRAKVVKLRKR